MALIFSVFYKWSILHTDSRAPAKNEGCWKPQWWFRVLVLRSQINIHQVRTCSTEKPPLVHTNPEPLDMLREMLFKHSLIILNTESLRNIQKYRKHSKPSNASPNASTWMASLRDLDFSEFEEVNSLLLQRKPRKVSMPPRGLVTHWLFGSLPSLKPLFIRGNAIFCPSLWLVLRLAANEVHSTVQPR